MGHVEGRVRVVMGGGGEHRTKGQPGMGTLRRETLEECGGRTGDHHMREGVGLGDGHR